MLSIGNSLPRNAWLRPSQVLADNFQTTLGTDPANRLSDRRPHAFTGFVGDPSHGTRISLAIAGTSLAAIVTETDGTTHEITTIPGDDGLLAKSTLPPTSGFRCRINPQRRLSSTSLPTESFPPAEPIIRAATLSPMNEEGGKDPASGNYDHILDPVPGGQLYENSLPDAYLLVVLDKSATGEDSTENLTTKTAQYIARIALLSAIYEHQIGIRTRFQELILIPDSASYSDIPFSTTDNNKSIEDFGTWGEANRPRTKSPRTYATKFGAGLSGSTIGLAYINTANTSLAYSLIRTEFDVSLLTHEAGHILGSIHSTGGVMNASYISGQQNFFTFTSTGQTAAQQIYNGSKNDFSGTAPLRHPGEIPFAIDDFTTSAPDTPVILTPLDNDLASVPGGEFNTSLTLLETGPVFPVGSATLVQDGNTLTLSPKPGYEGIVWFSYTLKGSVGNGGEGWLHKGDAAVLFGDPPLKGSLTLHPGDVETYTPDGQGDIILQSTPAHAHATIPLDAPRTILLHVASDASGSDSLSYTKDGQTYTLSINYSPTQDIPTRSDIFLHPGTSTLRFDPTQNDSFSGSRMSLKIQPTLGTTDTTADLLPNGHQLVSATLQDNSKGTLVVETHTHLFEGSTIQRKTGFLNFTPHPSATGIAEIRYTLQDAAGNSKEESALVYLKLHTITSPSGEVHYIRENHGIHLQYQVHGTSTATAITGGFTTTWDISAKPAHASATIASPGQTSTTATFSHPGNYTLRLTTKDSRGNQYQSTREVHVLAEGKDPPQGANLAPAIQIPSGTVKLSGNTLNTGSLPVYVMDDDGPAITPNQTWSLLSGSAQPTITSPNSTLTNIQFGTNGHYTLRLSSDDGAAKTFRELRVQYPGQSPGSPMAIGVAPIQLPSNSPAFLVPLYPLFHDNEDPDTSLTFSLLPSNASLLLKSPQIAGDPPGLSIQPQANTNGSGTLTVQATDTDGNSATTEIQVIVSNHPATIEDSTTTLPENSPEETTVHTPLTNNPDGDTLLFEILSSTPFPDTFAIDPGTGEITVANPGSLDFETNPEHTLKITVTDAHLLHQPRTATILVLLEDINEPPTLQLEGTTFTNLDPTPVHLANLAPVDPEGDALTLSILSGNDDNAFSIDTAKNLLLNDTSSFNLATHPRRTLTIRTTDNGTPPMSTDTPVRIDYHECINPTGTNDPYYLIPTNATVDATWQNTNFDHSGWTQGTFPIGFDTSRIYNPSISTNVKTDMWKKSTSLYIRIPFDITDTSTIGTFYLNADFDDGLTASLNGTRILTLNAPDTPAYNSYAIADQSATPPYLHTHDLKSHIHLLANGPNILSLHLLSSITNDPDAFLNARIHISSIGTTLAAAPPQIQSDGIGGFGIPGRTTTPLKGTILDTGGEQPSIGLVLDSQDKGENPDNWTHHFVLPTFTGTNFEHTATDLLPGTTYYYAFYGTNSGGTAWSATNNFSTRTNRLPSPAQDTYSATAGIPLQTTISNSVLANDSDPDSHPLSATLTNAPQHGIFQFHPDGTFSYTPDPTFSGAETFAYLLADPYDASSTSHTWIAKKGIWKYNDTGSTLGFTWRLPDYDDSAWTSGNAEMGYGDSDETTTLSYGGNPSAKTPAYYFRKTFTLPDDAVPLSARLILKRDDAAALFLNGKEFHRDANLPNLASSKTYATSATTLENVYSDIHIPATLLQPGQNLLAVEIHQATPLYDTDNDLSFDLELTGTLRATTTVTINVSPSDPSTDTDKDGLPDLLEYALGTDASTITSPSEATPALSFSSDTIDVTYTRAQTIFTYTIQTSANLKAWQDAIPSSTETNLNPNGTETFTATIPAPGPGNFFLRIQITTP